MNGVRCLLDLKSTVYARHGMDGSEMGWDSLVGWLVRYIHYVIPRADLEMQMQMAGWLHVIIHLNSPLIYWRDTQKVEGNLQLLLVDSAFAFAIGFRFSLRLSTVKYSIAIPRVEGRKPSSLVTHVLSHVFRSVIIMAERLSSRPSPLRT